MLTYKLPIINSKYFCSKCDYYTNKTSSYNKHLLTRKHIETINTNVATNNCECNICNKTYKSRVGLWKHKKTCKETTDIPSVTNNIPNIIENPSLVIELLKQNQQFKDLILEERREFQKIIIEQSAKMMELVGNMTENMSGNNHHNNNTTNTNSHNNFNLNVFINEQCKDTMILKDFVNNLEINMDKFIKTGEFGFEDKLLHNEV